MMNSPGIEGISKLMPNDGLLARLREREIRENVRANLWHEAMAEKFREAARSPWFPVAPDPPEPH